MEPLPRRTTRTWSTDADVALWIWDFGIAATERTISPANQRTTSVLSRSSRSPRSAGSSFEASIPKYVGAMVAQVEGVEVDASARQHLPNTQESRRGVPDGSWTYALALSRVWWAP
jgi:hypothetical protein